MYVVRNMQIVVLTLWVCVDAVYLATSGGCFDKNVCSWSSFLFVDGAGSITIFESHALVCMQDYKNGRFLNLLVNQVCIKKYHISYNIFIDLSHPIRPESNIILL